MLTPGNGARLLNKEPLIVWIISVTYQVVRSKADLIIPFYMTENIRPKHKLQEVIHEGQSDVSE